MSIAQISLGLLFFSTILIVWGIVKLHTYPGKVAEARGHPQRQAIEVTSLLGLLIFPLWMAALVWAYSGAIIGTLYTSEGSGGAPEPEGAGEKNPPSDPGGKKSIDAGTPDNDTAGQERVDGGGPGAGPTGAERVADSGPEPGPGGANGESPETSKPR